MSRLEIGSALDTRWFVERAPDEDRVGALARVKDGTGVVRAALVGAVDTQTNSRRDPAADAAAHAGRTLDVARDWLVSNGIALEVLASEDREEARAFYTRLRNGAQPGAVAARFADDLAMLVDDLDALHAAGINHGAIEPWMLLSRAEAPHLVLAGFAAARAVNRARVTPSDELTRLSSIALESIGALIDEVAITSSFPKFDPARGGTVWSESLRAWAGRVGGPYRQGAGAKAPLFPSAAYRDDPVELPTKRSRDDDPGLLSEMTRADTKLFVRIGMLLVVTVGGFVSFLVRSAMQSGPATPSEYELRDRRASEPPSRNVDRPDTTSCHGEPIAPLATSTLPGHGEVESIAAHCGGGAIRVMVHRGDSLWLVTRGSTVGMPWDRWSAENIVTDSIRALSRGAPSDDGTTFVSWISRDRGTVGVAQFGLPVVVHAAAVQDLDDNGSLFALGATARFAYVATPLGHPAARTAIVRVDLQAEREASRADVFTLANSIALSVWPRSDRPQLLVREGTSLRDVTVDLAQLDALDPSPRPRALPASAMHVEAESTPASPVLAAAPDAIAADFGNGTFGPVRFALALGASMGPGRYGETHLFTAQGGALADSPVSVLAAEPISFVSRIGGADLFVRALEGDVQRIAFTNEMIASPADRLVLPARAPRADVIDATACSETAWLVFADTRASDPRIAALPAACTTAE